MSGPWERHHRHTLNDHSGPLATPNPTEHHGRVAATSSDRVRRYLLRTHRLAIGPQTARELILVIRTSQPLDDDFRAEIRGTDDTGEPGVAVVTRDEIRRVLRHGA